jgi:hypothetical protein
MAMGSANEYQQHQTMEETIQIADNWLQIYAPKNFLISDNNLNELARCINLHFNGRVTIKTLSETVKALGDIDAGGRLEFQKPSQMAGAN